SFDFATVFAPGSRVDLYKPFPLSEETNRWGNTMALIGRLKPGMTSGAAQAEVMALAERTKRENPNINTFVPRLTPLRERVSGQLRSAMFVLACAVGLVMMIVCANLSNLLLARAATREKEIAIRAALGAGRLRLIRQMLTESLVLSCCGAAVGLLLAVGGTRLLSRLDDVRIPLLEQVRVDAGALGFTLLIAVLTGIVFGLTPAIRASSLSLQTSLKESGRGSSQGKRHGWIRGALVACYDEALRRVTSLTGIEDAGLTDALPLGTNRSWGVAAKGKTYERGKNPDAFVRIVSDGYLRAMGIRMRAGRDFSAADNPSSPRVIIINETLARALWPGEDPLGKIMRADVERQVIGVVRDVRHLALEQEPGGERYLPFRQSNDNSSILVVRGSYSLAGLASVVRVALRTIDPNLPSNDFRPIQDLVDRSISPRRLIVLLLAGFACFALILASLGIYG